ncbi:MAG TPA: PAS domain S-box protein [Gaiellaceae bacterium]|nr:PAS domain S-box protein [Gaiellaceae bacterium]
MSATADPLIQKSLVGEALEHGPVAIFVADDEQRYLAVNDFGCALLGYTRERLLELTVGAIAAYEEAQTEYAEMVRDGSRSGIAVLRRADGREVRVGYRAARTAVGAQTLFVSACWPLD